jgi:CrcB protein
VLLRQLGNGFPWGTLAVNLIGSFLAGFLVVWLEGRGPSAIYWRAFLMVGIMGGLTTFSALMVECLLYAKSGRTGLMLVYVGASLSAGMLLIWLGSKAAGGIRAPF